MFTSPAARPQLYNVDGISAIMDRCTVRSAYSLSSSRAAASETISDADRAYLVSRSRMTREFVRGHDPWADK